MSSVQLFYLSPSGYKLRLPQTHQTVPFLDALGLVGARQSLPVDPAYQTLVGWNEQVSSYKSPSGYWPSPVLLFFTVLDLATVCPNVYLLTQLISLGGLR